MYTGPSHYTGDIIMSKVYYSIADEFDKEVYLFGRERLTRALKCRTSALVRVV